MTACAGASLSCATSTRRRREVHAGQPRSRELLAAAPAAEHLATFRALFFDEGFSQNREARDACLEVLTRVAGRGGGG